MENFALNISVASYLNFWANSSLYASNLVIFGAVYLGWAMIIGLLFYIYDSRRRFKAFRISLMSLAAGLLALFVADLIKDFYPVARPFSAVKDVMALFNPGDISAFPSSHAAFFGGLATYLFLRDRRLGTWYLLVAVLVGVARVAGGVHFPLDILVGWGIAFLAALIFILIGNRLKI